MKKMEPKGRAVSAAYKTPAATLAKRPKIVIDLGDVEDLLRERFKQPLGGDPSPIAKDFVRQAVTEALVREAALASTARPASEIISALSRLDTLKPEALQRMATDFKAHSARIEAALNAVNGAIRRRVRN